MEKNYFIVGASSGIGKKTAEFLAKSGHKVYGTYHNAPLENLLPEVHYFPLDVYDDTQLESSLSQEIPKQLDGLVYCPGSIQLKPFHRFTSSDFITDYKLQVVGAVRILQLILPHLKASSQASVVLFSTIAVQTGLPFHSLVSSTKGALEGLTRALAAEFAPTIRVNCIAPSLTDTPLASSLLNTDQKKLNNAERHPLKRIGNPEDIAYLVEYLLSQKASWITGQIFKVDGGISTLKS